MSNRVIALNAVNKRFGNTVAVDDLSLSLEEGEFFALLGPSGCGKTTLLRMLAGFETPDSGEILLDGKDITRLDPNRRPLNMMFQSYALFPHMSVRANVSYGLEMERLDSASINRRVDEILDVTQIKQLASRKPSELSGGQRQRVALARALVKQPRVLLLDEPLAALDKKLREQMQLELKRLQHEFAITFVVVTHDQEEALVMADRVGLMHDGRLVQVSSPAALYDEPVSRFAAEFIGRTNFIEGVVVSSGLQHSDAGLIATQVPHYLSAGDAAVVSLRPERIHISDSADRQFDNRLPGEVVDTAFYGQHTAVIVRVEGLSIPIEASVPVGTGATQSIKSGDQVWCHWQANHGRLLPNPTE